jgi:AraC-like DNA-binding protein
VLVKDLETAQKALAAEQSARSKADQALAEERAAKQVAEQILQQSKDVNAALSLKLDNVETSLAIAQDKLDRKSKALDSQTARSDEAELRLKNAENKLKTVEADLEAKGLLLESAQQALAKREGSANMMISSAVAHAAALFKNHRPELNMEILRHDFTVDDTEREP